ncbi:MAG: hypothetical protein ACK5ME_06500 [Parahaliea sp.]
MKTLLFPTAALTGAIAIFWMGLTFLAGTQGQWLALAVILVIAGVYLLGLLELLRYRTDTVVLQHVIESTCADDSESALSMPDWLNTLPKTLRRAVQARIEGERSGLPVPVFSAYLVGLLVMLGLLGTFFGMVDTLSGARVALDANADLEAIRSGLAAPIAGLGVAFGTSVAGIAASAALGLCSVLVRRERALAVAALDEISARYFSGHDRAYRQLQAFDAMQAQAEVLPQIARQLLSLTSDINTLGSELHQTLLDNQARFFEQHSTDSKVLADTITGMATQLKDTLLDSQRGFLEQHSDSSQVLANSLTQAGAEVNATILKRQQAFLDQHRSDTGALVERLTAMLGKLADNLSDNQSQLQIRLEEDFGTLATSIGAALEAHLAGSGRLVGENLQPLVEQAMRSVVDHSERSQKRLIDISDEKLGYLAERLDSTTDNLRTSLHDNAQAQREAQHELSQHFAETLQHSAAELIGRQQSTFASLGEQQQVLLEQLSVQYQQKASELATQQHEAMSQLLSRSGELIASNADLLTERVQAEQQWLASHQQRMEAIASTTGTALEQLHVAEEQRSEAALQRLAALEDSVADHLARLGAELETPMLQLIESASETPRAAAEVISRLREELGNGIERDNHLLQERQLLLEQLMQLMQSMDENASAQREGLAGAADRSANVLHQIGERFDEQLAQRLQRMDELLADVSSGAIEISSLGESLEVAVNGFGEANGALISALERIEQALEQGSTRSDEQLAYYVAQAREIIDHSVLSQKELIEGLRQLGKQENLFDTEKAESI